MRLPIAISKDVLMNNPDDNKVSDVWDGLKNNYPNGFASVDVGHNNNLAPRVYVIHDGRECEYFPIFSCRPFFSVMGGCGDPSRPNNWRKTELRDDLPHGDNIKAKEFHYSEFTSLYSVWKLLDKRVDAVGFMHYRSFLNLEQNPTKMTIDHEVYRDKLPTEMALGQKSYNNNSDCCDRMGYNVESVRSLMRNYDILTSTPLFGDFAINSITSQMIAAHGSRNDTLPYRDGDSYLLRLLVKAGRYVYEYNVSDTRSPVVGKDVEKDWISTLENTQEIILKEELQNLGLGSGMKVSASWDEYSGMSNYILNRYAKDEKSRPSIIPARSPYFKDLFIFKRDIFEAYMKFIMYVLDKLFDNDMKDIRAYGKLMGNKEKITDGSFRLLAFIGERLTGYFIDSMVGRGRPVAAFPRVHYGSEGYVDKAKKEEADREKLCEFMRVLYPEVEHKGQNYKPFFELHKRRCEKTGNELCDTRYVSTNKDIKILLEKGYVLIRCMGYLLKNQGKKLYGCKKIGNTIDDRRVVEIEKNDDDYYNLGYEVQEGNKTFLKSLYEYTNKPSLDKHLLRDPITEEIKRKKPAKGAIVLATFGRKDL